MKREDKKEPLVSIIIPAYNTERFISDCLDSILKQTYKSIEVIVIDDGSSDNTGCIIENYAKKDKRVKVVKGEHCGANAARGLGVKKASGAFYMFVDSDDWIDAIAVERLVNYMLSNKCDVVKFNEILEPSKVIKHPHVMPNEKNVIVGRDQARHILTTSYILNGLCHQFYRSELFDGIKSFDKEISNCEDYLVNLEIYDKVESVLFIGDALYHYRENFNSTTKNTVPERIIKNLSEQIYVYSCMLRKIEDWKFSSEEKKHVAVLTLDKIRRGILNLFRISGMSRKKFVEELSDIIADGNYSYIHSRIKNRWILKSEIKKMSLAHRLKHGKALLSLYDGDFDRFWHFTTLYRIVSSNKQMRRSGSISKYMRGRLGNQLFQYATLRKIQEENGGKDELNLNFSKYIYSLGFANDLKYFQVKPYHEMQKLKINRRQIVGIVLHKIERRFILLLGSGRYRRLRYNFEDKKAKRLQRIGIYWKEDGALKIGKTVAGNKIAIGHFESAKNFDDIRPQLLQEIQPIEPPLAKNEELYKTIGNGESVCISIRRGDFVENPKFAKNFNVCGKEYFEDAVKEIKKRVKKPIFVMFSDDIEWCKKNILLPGEKVYYEDGTDPVWEKLRLMYSCKHFIISNSTFSWWAQYLSRNENKIVIAPKVWTNFGYNKDIYDESWVVVDNKASGGLGCLTA